MKYKVKKLISYYKPYKKTFFMDLFMASMSAAILLIIPLIIRHITNEILLYERSKAIQAVVIWGIFISLLFFALYGCNYYILYYGHVMGTKMERDMREELFCHYQKLSCSFYDEQKIGKLMSRMTNDLYSLGEFLHRAPEEILTISMKMLGAFVMFFLVNRALVVVILVMFVAIFLHIWYFVPKVSKVFLKNHEKTSEINSTVEESLSGIRVVKSFANEKLELHKFEEANEEFVTSRKEAFKLMGFFHSGNMSLVIGLLPIITMVAMFFILNGSMVIGDLISCMLYIDILIGPMFSLMELFEQFQESFAGYQRFLEILEIKPEIVNSANAVELKRVAGGIAFENVSFQYNKDEKNVLTKLNLNIKSGEYVALIGPSGIGKSTLCSLIPRFYEVQSGKITIDGVDIREIKIKNLRDNIGFVQQDVYLFSGTVRENIRYGKENATEEEIIAAAKDAMVHDFIVNFPDGYDTNIGQRGLKLSGGQKQRLAIARVFLKNPRILIFDEATSSLDVESERCVQRSLEKLAINRTTIVIAHRLSTIKKAKRILVLTQNGITEDGTHDELISKNGVYAELYKLL
ncbi:thiamine ABC transporter permease [Clostridia bacterium]|nr:thiamine ABC transporter permease [Clostridia bacterium]